MPLNPTYLPTKSFRLCQEDNRAESSSNTIRSTLDYLRHKFYVWNPKHYKLQAQQQQNLFLHIKDIEVNNVSSEEDFFFNKTVLQLVIKTVLYTSGLNKILISTVTDNKTSR